ncbi:hybrid sensor histidine kinase/response regulator [Desulfococcaceae bacterium HSG9]|nr:hybrid sensor histidine kinase/response regulator [Desulfococcaceae bacterium HSG9]
MSAIKKSSILIIDDGLTNLHVLEKILRPEKYETILASDGFKGLELALEELPDLILLDIMMPGMNGFEVCKRLKQNPVTKDIPVIFISAIHELSEKVKGFQIGGVDYITKPIQREEVIARVDVHLNLKRSREELTNANAAKDKLMAVIGHDLRGPLGSLMQALDMLIKFDGQLNKQKRLDMLAELHNGAKRTFNLLENTLCWARSQSGDIIYQPENLKLKAIVDDNIQLFSDFAHEKAIQLNFDIDEALSIYADKNMLTVVLRNLISNALKFTPQSGEVKVTAIAKKEFVEITVVDNGVGIATENRKKLFDPGNHFTTYGTQNEKGTGLGLLLCKEFVEKNGGNIRVESVKKGGSAFKFTVPHIP